MRKFKILFLLICVTALFGFLTDCFAQGSKQEPTEMFVERDGREYKVIIDFSKDRPVSLEEIGVEKEEKVSKPIVVEVEVEEPEVEEEIIEEDIYIVEPRPPAIYPLAVKPKIEVKTGQSAQLILGAKPVSDVPSAPEEAVAPVAPAGTEGEEKAPSVAAPKEAKPVKVAKRSGAAKVDTFITNLGKKLTFSIAGYEEYDDNVFLDENNEKRDLKTIIAPEIYFEQSWDKAYLGLGASGTVTYYRDYSEWIHSEKYDGLFSYKPYPELSLAVRDTHLHSSQGEVNYAGRGERALRLGYNVNTMTSELKYRLIIK